MGLTDRMNKRYISQVTAATRSMSAYHYHAGEAKRFQRLAPVQTHYFRRKRLNYQDVRLMAPVQTQIALASPVSMGKYTHISS